MSAIELTATGIGGVTMVIGSLWLLLELADFAINRVAKRWRIVPAFVHFMFASKWYKGDPRMSATLDGQEMVWKEAEKRGLAKCDRGIWTWITD